MNREWLVISVLLILLCTVVFTLSSCSSGGAFSEIFLAEYSEESLEITEDFDSIVIDVVTADIKLMVSDDDVCRLVAYSQEKIKYVANVTDGKLTVNVKDERAWYDHIAFVTETPKLTLYLPKAQYETLVIDATTGDVEVSSDFTFRTADISLTTGDVELLSTVTGLAKIKSTTGDIKLSDMSAASIDITLTTGDASLENVACEGDISLNIGSGETNFTNVTCHNFTTDGTTGSMSLVNVIAKGKMTLERTTADITFEHCDASELSVKTDTGDVTGTLLTKKIFIPRTTTGKINVPETTEGGVCKITTTTGKIIISIAD